MILSIGIIILNNAIEKVVVNIKCTNMTMYAMKKDVQIQQ